jgi:hypothetical protein
MNLMLCLIDTGKVSMSLTNKFIIVTCSSCVPGITVYTTGPRI